MGATFIRLNPERLNGRIDATYYRAQFVANEERLRTCGAHIQQLNNLIHSGRRAVYFSTSTIEREEAPDNWVPFLTSDDFGTEGFGIDLNARRYVSPEFADQYPNGRLRANELLVKVKGPNQITAYNSKEPTKRVLVSGTIWGALVRNEQVDPHYLVTVLSSDYAVLARSRLRTNLNVEFLSPNDLVELELPIPRNPRAQKYIGDKVRQAEQLRFIANQSFREAFNVFENEISLRQILDTKVISRRITGDTLYDRLDVNFNSPDRFRLIEHLKSKKIHCTPLEEIANISAMIGWKGLTTEHYTSEGPWLLRGIEFENGTIDIAKLVSVSRHKYDEQPQIHFRPDDIALTKDGTIGKAIVIPELPNEMAAGSTIARIRLKDRKIIDPYYLEFVLNHSVLQIQIKSFSTGMAQPHITQEWIARLLIPRIRCEPLIAQCVRQHHTYQCLSKALVLIAKHLVEGLIEGTITEVELAKVQNALQANDQRMDCQILSRIIESQSSINECHFFDLNTYYNAIRFKDDNLSDRDEL